MEFSNCAVMSDVVFSGVYDKDGHFVSFILNDFDVRIIETYADDKQNIKEKNIEIDEAIIYQQRLVHDGYTQNLKVTDIKTRIT
tara:strand:- start:1115 stop:1366 length:252 start_codon:yes stop_codon:yes gene_type:complete